ncbi:MAG: tRNA lysidine(34) synthetase TilS [Spirochaetes bacterium RBG_13_51_14]|nr:MAG: tRNA lysidine(34) synthetase TilS [Spirochaetes bacterium RBG_13_51_14]
MEEAVARVRNYINRHALIEKGDRVLLSLSAGKDSMFLFHVMNLLSAEYSLRVGVFHLNHLMRGADSDRDEIHVATLATSHGIDVFIERHDFDRNRRGGRSLEEPAREKRYALLSEIAGSHGYNKIATAHTGDDQIETVLMRIFTGTGIHGLQGIPARRDAIIRPLLGLSSTDIYEYLNSHGIVWFEDVTNTDVSRARNYIRHEIIPVIRKRFPMMRDAIQSLSEVAAETVSLLNELIAVKFPYEHCVSGNDVYIDVEMLLKSYPAFCHAVSTAIRVYFKHQTNRTMLAELYSKCLVDRANVGLFRDKRIRVDKVFRDGRIHLRISPGIPADPVPAEWEYVIDLDDFQERKLDLREIGVSVTVKPADYEYFQKFNKNNRYIFVTLDEGMKSLYIRNRRKGDTLRTEYGTKKIKELLIENKFDAVTKNRVPLLSDGSTVIAFMPGLLFDIPNRVASDFLVDKKDIKVLAVFKN